MVGMQVLVAVIAASFGSYPAGQEIAETMRKPLRATLASPKKPIDLELCVADAITQVGGAIPIPIHEGPKRTIMLGYGHTPKLVIEMNERDSGTELRVFTKSGDSDDRFVEKLKASCNL